MQNTNADHNLGDQKNKLRRLLPGLGAESVPEAALTRKRFGGV